MFRSSVPVTAELFRDRREEIQKLEAHVDALVAGAPSWVAIIGPRKVGKTSLVLEVARRRHGPALAFLAFDVLEVMPLSLDVFRRYAVKACDVLLGPRLGISLESAARDRATLAEALIRGAAAADLDPALRADLLELAERGPDGERARRFLDLPERVAKALGVRLIAAWDEFQELAELGQGRGGEDPFPLMRSAWQRHEEVAYFISGSARTMLEALVTSRASPFFQHFSVLDLGPFAERDAVSLLVESAPPGRPIPEALAVEIHRVVGGHPFYLQVIGEALIAMAPPYDEPALREALQAAVFSRTGRLGLYFENELLRLVGRSTFLAATLDALSDGPRRASEIAVAIGAPSGATARYVDRLGDVVVRQADGRYALADPLFARWIAWRRPGGAAVPMKLLGDEGEAAAALHLAKLGFDLVYQSRTSRGAFDLLATRGPAQLGIQVKRTALPLRFPIEAWSRMKAEAARYGWRWAVVQVEPAPSTEVRALDPSRAKRARSGVSLGVDATIENLLAWIDAPGPRVPGKQAGPPLDGHPNPSGRPRRRAKAKP